MTGAEERTSIYPPPLLSGTIFAYITNASVTTRLGDQKTALKSLSGSRQNIGISRHSSLSHTKLLKFLPDQIKLFFKHLNHRVCPWHERLVMKSCFVAKKRKEKKRKGTNVIVKAYSYILLQVRAVHLHVRRAWSWQPGQILRSIYIHHQLHQSLCHLQQVHVYRQQATGQQRDQGLPCLSQRMTICSWQVSLQKHPKRRCQLRLLASQWPKRVSIREEEQISRRQLWRSWERWMGSCRKDS